jgi:hypothetical protein
MKIDESQTAPFSGAGLRISSVRLPNEFSPPDFESQARPIYDSTWISRRPAGPENPRIQGRRR